MAVTRFAVNSPETVKLWSKSLAIEALKATEILPLIGSTSNSIIQEKDETEKSAGDAITFMLRSQLTGRGATELETMEGNEEALSHHAQQLLINELVHAVRVRGASTIDAQRVPFNLRLEAREGLADWFATRISTMAFIHFCGYTGNELNIIGRDTILSPHYWGFNKPLAPSKNRFIIANGKANEEALVESDVFNLRMIDQAVESAKLANPKLRPVNVNGDTVYVMYLHPTQVTALRTNTDQGQWLDIQKAAYNGSRANNPIFDGSLGMYNKVILRESEAITPGLSTKGKALPNVRRAVLLGAQAGVIAFGRVSGKLQTASDGRTKSRFSYTEEIFDYDRELGVAAKTNIGFKKSRFSGDYGDGEDFGTIVVSTYAKRAV